MRGEPILTAGVLFDFDGTLVDSASSYDGVWRRWANARGVDPAPILAEHHGRRFADTLRMTGHGAMDLVAEGKALYAMSLENTDGLRLLPGVAAMLTALPAQRWGIVTSAGSQLVRQWLDHFGLPHPVVLVTGESVERGKPAPDGYLMGAEGLGLSGNDCIAFEDAPAGIAAAQAAGCNVIGLNTTHRGRLPAGLRVIDDYAELRFETADTGLSLHL